MGVALVAIAACSTPGSDSQSTARAFLDAHYVRIDLEASRELCVGLARDKLDSEIALTRGNPIGEDTRRPRVTYSLQEAHDDAERSQYAYELEVHPGGSDVFRRLVLVSLRRDGGRWAVSNFNESDRPGK
jgi:hypothetical protein